MVARYGTLIFRKSTVYALCRPSVSFFIVDMILEHYFNVILYATACFLANLFVFEPGDNIFSSRKHVYSNILKILPPKNENFQIKNSDIFHISAQNIDCGYLLEPPRRGSSNNYPQSMFLRRHKKNNVYPYKPQFYNIKMGFKGVKII